MAEVTITKSGAFVNCTLATLGKHSLTQDNTIIRPAPWGRLGLALDTILSGVGSITVGSRGLNLRPLRRRTFACGCVSGNINRQNKFWGEISIFWTQGLCFYITGYLAVSVVRVDQLVYSNIDHFLLRWSCDGTRFGVPFSPRCVTLTICVVAVGRMLSREFRIADRGP